MAILKCLGLSSIWSTKISKKLIAYLFIYFMSTAVCLFHLFYFWRGFIFFFIFFFLLLIIVFFFSVPERNKEGHVISYPVLEEIKRDTFESY